MSDPTRAGAPPTGATLAQLQHDIDSGRTGDKVGGFDPAAAPLGTDEEAAGERPSPALVAQARRQQRSGAPDSARANAATPAMAPDARLPSQRGLVLAGAVGLAAGVAVAALLFAAL